MNHAQLIQQLEKQNQLTLLSCLRLSETSPFVSIPTKLNLSDCGIPGSIATMLGRCSIVVVEVVLTNEGETGEIGEVVSELSG